MNVDKLQDVIVLPSGGDIYSEARKEQILKNCSVYPYKTDASELTDLEKQRIHSRSLSFNIKPSAGEEIALSSPAGWVVMVFPPVEKQGYQEKALGDYLKTFMKEVETLPKSGLKAIYLSQGGQLLVNQKRKPHTTSRSLDFVVKTLNNTTVYIVAKFTQGQGGAQNSQADHASFAVEQQTPTSQINLAVILDGNYYTESPNGVAKLRELKEYIQEKKISHNTFVGNYSEATNWLKHV